MRIVDPGHEEVLTGTTVFVFNAPRYALGLPFVPAARDDDGWLDVIVFLKPGPFQALYYLWKVFRGTHLHDPACSIVGSKKRARDRRDIASRSRSTATQGAICRRRPRTTPTRAWTVEVIPVGSGRHRRGGPSRADRPSSARQRRRRAIRSSHRVDPIRRVAIPGSRP